MRVPYFIDLFRPFYIYYIGSIVLVPIILALKQKIEIQEKEFKPFMKLIEQLETRLSAVENFQEVIKQKIGD